MDERDYKAMNAELRKESLEEKAEKEYPKEFLGSASEVFERAAFVKGYLQAIQAIEMWAINNTYFQGEYVDTDELLFKLSELKQKP